MELCFSSLGADPTVITSAIAITVFLFLTGIVALITR